MTTTLFNNALLEMLRGTTGMNFPAGANSAYKVMLVGTGSTYTPVKSHITLTDFTNNGGVEASGTGYTAGGIAPANLSSLADSSNAINMTPDSVSWNSSSISAKGAIFYNSANGKMVAYVDFGGTVTSSNSTFTVSFTTPLKLQN
jgi:hypothetical protein